jgi:plasmid stability protein
MLLCFLGPVMRTTVELPDPLFRALKARAALEGRSLKSLMGSLLEQGLHQGRRAEQGAPRSRSALPSVRTGVPFGLTAPSNADLFELLDADP